MSRHRDESDPMPRPSRGALSRFRVIDLTRVRAGPTCVKQLADFGADVIKVESPPGVGEDPDIGGVRDGFDMQNLHRNKRSMTLNLKSPEGRAILHALARDADVVVENYRPDVKARLGCDYATLRGVNPRIVLTSVSGFGQGGPYVLRPGVDQVAQGMSGLMSVTGFPDGEPTRTGAAICDVTAGLLAALGTMTALLEREVSGEGQWVQTSLLQAGVALMDFQASRYTFAGEVGGRVGNDHATMVPTSAYPTADGRINVATTGNAIWERLCGAIGAPELARRPEYLTMADRVAHRDALNAELAAVFATRGNAEWIDRLNAAGVPCGPIWRVDELFADPQAEYLGLSVPVDHPRLGRHGLLDQMVTLTRTPAEIRSPTPELGAHTDEVLAGLGYDASARDALRARGVI